MMCTHIISVFNDVQVSGSFIRVPPQRASAVHISAASELRELFGGAWARPSPATQMHGEDRSKRPSIVFYTQFGFFSRGLLCPYSVGKPTLYEF